MYTCREQTCWLIKCQKTVTIMAKTPHYHAILTELPLFHDNIHVSATIIIIMTHMAPTGSGLKHCSLLTPNRTRNICLIEPCQVDSTLYTISVSMSKWVWQYTITKHTCRVQGFNSTHLSWIVRYSFCNFV